MRANTTRRVFLHAPSIHVGGGLELLRGLLSSCSSSFDILQLDKRIQGSLALPNEAKVLWVEKSVGSRLYAECKLYRQCGPDDLVLCFHGLPPIFRLSGRVILFVQNRILLETGPLAGYSFLTRIRLNVERLWMRGMQRNCNKFIVQTASMANAVRSCLGSDVAISVQTFGPQADVQSPASSPLATAGRSGFVYVASGEAHKNHETLLEAWRLLAEAGLKPSLTLTVSPQAYPLLAGKIAGYVRQFGLNIVNAGHVPKECIHALYRSSSALIFASRLESFGLPLIEARHIGLPVLAPELDYVRDVIEPAETFDPSSPLSIARAVRRFLGKPEQAAPVGSAADFLAEVCR